MTQLSDIRIIFCDIDGTLLPFSGKELRPTAALIKRLIEKGIAFVPCTGRGTHNIPPEILGIPGIRYAITANGALVMDLETDEVLRQRTVDRGLAHRMVEFARARGITLFTYRYGVHYLDDHFPVPYYPPENISLGAWMASVIRTDFHALIDAPDTRYLDKLGVFSCDDALKALFLRDLEKEPFANDFCVTSSAYWNLEVNAAGGSKGDAALWLCEQLGYDRSQMLTAGDNRNDLSMIEAGAISVAPENAVPEIKAAASVVVPDCAEDGVEKFLEQLLV